MVQILKWYQRIRAHFGELAYPAKGRIREELMCVERMEVVEGGEKWWKQETDVNA